MNRVTLVGRLTKDPELSMTPSGVAVAKFTLAVNRQFSNNQGEKEADFITVVVWRKQAENVNQYLKKGSLCGVDGRLQVRNYEGQDGKRIYVTEVIAESVTFLDSKPQNEQSNFGRTAEQSMYAQSQGNSYDPFANMGGRLEISEDSLPF